MPEGFTKVFSERLDKACEMKVIEACEGMKISKNTIYIAKGGQHMTVGPNNNINLNKCFILYNLLYTLLLICNFNFI